MILLLLLQLNVIDENPKDETDIIFKHDGICTIELETDDKTKMKNGNALNVAFHFV